MARALPKAAAGGGEKPFRPVDSPKEYLNPGEGFAISIPEGWKQAAPDETTSAALFYARSDGFKENLNVRVAELPGDPDEVSKEFLSSGGVSTLKGQIQESFPSAKVKEPERSTVGGQPAWKIVYDYNVVGVDNHVVQWMVLNGNRLYTLTWTGSVKKNHASQVDELVRSFKFIPSEE